MRRALLALVLCLASGLASAQYTIKVSFTYTAAAATAAGGAAALESQVNTLLGVANARYTASGAGIQLASRFAFNAAITSPADSRPMANQYKWATSSPESVSNRGSNTDASISVHISNPPGGTASYLSPNPTGGARETYMVLPQANLASELESAIGRIFGVDPAKGYTRRAWLYPSDAAYTLINHGICYHTYDAPAPSDPATVVPYLPYHQTSSQVRTQAATAVASCAAWRDIFLVPGSISGTFVGVDVTSSPGFCKITNSSGTQTALAGMIFVTPAGGATVSCTTENLMDIYSTPGVFIAGTSLPGGDAGHNNAGTIAGRASTVFGYSIGNGSEIVRAKENAPWWGLLPLTRWR